MFNKIFTYSNKQNNIKNNINTILLTNSSLLNTSQFKNNKNNKQLMITLQNINDHFQTGEIRYNLIKNKCEKNPYYLNTHVTNYTPIIHYNTISKLFENSNNCIQHNMIFKKFAKTVNYQFFVQFIINFLEKYNHKKI